MHNTDSLTLEWDNDNAATLPAHGLTFTVSDACGEEAYRGFYWLEESANQPIGEFTGPEEAKKAAQDWVRREVPRMAFLVEAEGEDAAEEGIPAGHYLLTSVHLPLLGDEDVHDAVSLLGLLAREQSLPRVFTASEEARAEAELAGLVLHDPSHYGLV